MKFGVREICDVVFKSLQTDSNALGGMGVVKGQPVLYIDSAKTSTVEGAATTVYAQGGKGNSRLVAWEGEKTLTFTVEDALLSPVGFAILSGAGLFDNNKDNKTAYVHATTIASVYKEGSSTYADLDLENDEALSNTTPLFVMEYKDGSVASILKGCSPVTEKRNTIQLPNTDATQVFVDFYVEKRSGVTELQIDAENFAGYYYVEASTLFRREVDGKDLPAEIVFPKVKIQSNFTFTMASSGDPSTFTFTMDAFPAYTMFNNTKKVLCAMQIIEDSISNESSSAVTMNKNHFVDTDFTKEDSSQAASTTHTVTYKIAGITVAQDKVRDGYTTVAPAFEVTTWNNGSTAYNFESPVTADLELTAVTD